MLTRTGLLSFHFGEHFLVLLWLQSRAKLETTCAEARLASLPASSKL
jgi:hypothetical protein